MFVHFCFSAYARKEAETKTMQIVTLHYEKYTDTVILVYLENIEHENTLKIIENFIQFINIFFE